MGFKNVKREKTKRIKEQRENQRRRRRNPYKSGFTPDLDMSKFG